MGTSTQQLFGSTNGVPAEPGSYGHAPRGFRLPNETRLGRVRLRVANLGRSIDFYEAVLGMRTIRRGEPNASLGAVGDDRVLLELHEHVGARPASRRARLGLYHFAIL